MGRTTTLLLAALLVVSRAASAQVTVLQLNDVYRIDAVDNGTAGGLGRVVTLIEQSRKRGEKLLVLHAGDFISPSLESQYWGGRQMIEALNFVAARAPLLIVPGNHEYDSSRPANLTAAITASRFPWLADNLRLATGTAADQRIQGDTILDIGGVRVGIFALTMIDAPRAYAKVDTQYLAIAEQHISALERAGADAIVGLTHLPVEVDRAMAGLRRTHPRFLWIVSGHEHDSFSFPLTDSTALITNGASNARTVWRVKLSKAGGTATLAAQEVALGMAMAIDRTYDRDITQHYRAELIKLVPFFDQQIGTTSVPLVATEEAVRETESNWGNYLTDVMRMAYPNIPADIAILNGGAIRIDDTVLPGTIRWEHLARTFGFATRVALVWLRGADVKSLILENSVSQPAGDGRFLQVSGVRFRFDRRQAVGARVSDVAVQRGTSWEPLDPQEIYVVAVPDYIYNGGDGYGFRSAALITVPPGPDLKLMVFDALASALAQGQAIAPKVEDRIRELK